MTYTPKPKYQGPAKQDTTKTDTAQLKARGYSAGARSFMAGASAAANDTTSALGRMKSEGARTFKATVRKADSTISALKDKVSNSYLAKQARGEGRAKYGIPAEKPDTTKRKK
jgi:hypothetical protein